MDRSKRPDAAADGSVPVNDPDAISFRDIDHRPNYISPRRAANIQWVKDNIDKYLSPGGVERRAWENED